MPELDQAVNNPPFSVSTLNRLVRECLEARFPLSWVSGEISNLTYAASGHVYFSLKDASAQVRCVMWRSRAQLLGWRLENGHKIEARALISFYEPRGEFQLNVESIRRAGQGDLFERFLRIKAQLESEGLFASDTKRPLPPYPARLAIVTSLQAAALRDVLSTLKRRAPQLQIVLFPTPVQGEGAGAKIAEAIAMAGNSACDALILCRGGGSIEDLWAFNDEIVARAIRASAIPVVTGIGHETDFTIADFAADLRAPTPTAAAELISPDRNSLLARLIALEGQLLARIERRFAETQQQLDWLTTRLIHPAERIRQNRIELEALNKRLGLALRHRHEACLHRLNTLTQRLHSHQPQPQALKIRLDHLQFRLAAQFAAELSRLSARLSSQTASLKQLDPAAVLNRGYALALDQDGHVVRDATSLEPGELLTLRFAHGAAKATVNSVVASPEAD